MLVREYDAFVRSTDLNESQDRDAREDIAVYGVVGEMGALTSAVKRRLQAEQHGVPWNLSTAEIEDELGDALWYWSLLCQLYNNGSESVLKIDISNLISHLSAADEKGELFRTTIGEDRTSDFKERAAGFLLKDNVSFDEYREISLLTQRTEGKIFVGVCLTVLSQLGAELLRKKFPGVENQINTVIDSRPIDTILGETAWHLAAIASTYNLTLDEVASLNRAKINRRLDNSNPTPSHDDGYPEHERFSRNLEISFIMVGQGRARMYLDGRRLGDELTDNSYTKDGYRFHDVLHLAVLANLGWSPVLRDLLKRKRKSNPEVDEVEDGARARIVDEAVVKAIHSEGMRVSIPRAKMSPDNPVPLFASRGEISFQFLSFIDNLTRGLEVSDNQYWEWERAILQASDVFHKLMMEEQGTVTVNLDAAEISFEPNVYIDSPGVVVGMGTALIDAAQFSESERASRTDLDWAGEKKRLLDAPEIEIAIEVATKRAILSALNLLHEQSNYDAFHIVMFKSGVSVKADGPVRQAMWNRKVISFRVAITSGQSLVSCTVVGVADPADRAQ